MFLIITKDYINKVNAIFFIVIINRRSDWEKIPFHQAAMLIDTLVYAFAIKEIKKFVSVNDYYRLLQSMVLSN